MKMFFNIKSFPIRLHMKKILKINGRSWWHKPVIPATWEMEIRKITVEGQPRQKVRETPSQLTS
jgi:hypothetical protein